MCVSGQLVRACLAALLGLATVAAACAVPFRGQLVRRYYADWYKTNFALCEMISCAPRALPVPAEGTTQLVREAWVHNCQWLDRTDWKPAVALESQAVVDAWGSPIRLERGVPFGDQFRPRFVSFGPNKRDEHGTGDDMVAEPGLKPCQYTWPQIPRGAQVVESNYPWFIVPVLAIYPAMCLMRPRSRGMLMLRLVVASVLAIPAAGLLALWIVSYVQPLGSWRSFPSLGPHALNPVARRGMIGCDYMTGPVRMPDCEPQGGCEDWNAGRRRTFELAGLVVLADGPRNVGICEQQNWTTVRAPMWMVVAVVGAYPAVFFPLAIRRARRKRRQLGEGFCTRCGYNLTGLIDRRCPECGRPF